MTADTIAPTYAGHAIAANGYPTDLTPADAARTASGVLLSWEAGVKIAASLGDFREHVDAGRWTELVNAARQYGADRTGIPAADLAGLKAADLAFIVTVMIEAARR